jgi:hypothetical protein
MIHRRFPFPPELRLCAAALAGDADALAELAARPDLEPLVVANRIAPGLAIRATELGADGPQLATWTEHMRAAAVMRLQLGAAMRNLADTLATASIAWTPLKGMGLDPRIYPHPEERITTDIDALVSPADLDRAVAALVATGWHNLVTTDRQRAYTLDEGYNCKLAFAGVSLELHFRLWGGVTERFAADIFERTTPAPELGATARRITPADAYLVAAVHVWQTPPPRYLALWWDLHRMACVLGDHETQAVIERAREHGLQLFVALSAASAADLWDHQLNARIADAPVALSAASAADLWDHEFNARIADAPVARSAAAAADLWDHQLNARIADALEPHLRAPERWAARRLAGSSPATASLGILTFGRLLAGRPSRSGWRAIPRRIWAHPGTVDADTPAAWPWPRRRLTHVGRRLASTKKQNPTEWARRTPRRCGNVDAP